jgi:hypothetical protein
MSDAPVRTDRVSIGEGFAFFRFHTLMFSYSACRGYRDKRPGMGYCFKDWRKLNRG